MKHLEYKGYTGSIEYSKEDELMYGKVLGIRGLISYEGVTGPELEVDFKAAIDDYLELCEAKGIKADKPFKGSFNVRISSELHREAAILAAEQDMNLNALVKDAIKARVASPYHYLSSTAALIKGLPKSGKTITTRKKVIKK